METNTCRRGQKTVVVLASHNFGTCAPLNAEANKKGTLYAVRRAARTSGEYHEVGPHT